MNDSTDTSGSTSIPPQPIRLLSVVGTRPQFIKLAPLLDAIAAHNAVTDPRPVIEHRTLHTGQHYDEELSQVFFDELHLPPPDIRLDAGSGSHGQQTARMLTGIERALLEQRPDVLIVYGDTNSTLAGALAAAKLQLPVAHIEAGLRSFNRRMPEEINRIATDHLSDLLLAPTATALAHLRREGLADKAILTGDIMYDAVLRNTGLPAGKHPLPKRLQLSRQSYYLATVHRAENTDRPEPLRAILEQLNELAMSRYPVVFPMHPRTAQRLQEFLPDWRPRPELRIVPPLGYLEMLTLLQDARLTLTDSGGLQKEAFFLNCPCITLREETEWVETVDSGGNILTGADPERIRQAVRQWEERLEPQPVDFSADAQQHYGDGEAAQKILRAILRFLQSPLYS